MKTVGIITEYNPFHFGHKYQLQTVREKTKADAIVVLMSGNVVQRGEFAIIDKWHRAEAAVKHGADLVIEMPLVNSLQAADYFSDWSVKLFHKLNIQTLAFGTETADSKQLTDYVLWQQDNIEALNQLIKKFLKSGLSYPASYQRALESLINPEEIFGFNPQLSNHTLAIQYVKANLTHSNRLEILPVPRINEIEPGSQKVYSGSEIREFFWQGMALDDKLPALMSDKLTNEPAVQMSDYYSLLNYQIMSQSAQRLKQYIDISEGLENFIYQSAKTSNNYQDLLDTLTTRRWSKSAIQRKLMGILLNITQDEWRRSITLNEKFAQLRILAYNPKGRLFLRTQKGNEQVNLFSNLTQDIAENYALNLRADQVYQLNPRIEMKEQQFGRFPLKIKSNFED